MTVIVPAGAYIFTYVYVLSIALPVCVHVILIAFADVGLSVLFDAVQSCSEPDEKSEVVASVTTT
jgi:hypothetical protein